MMRDWLHKYPRVQALLQQDSDELAYAPDEGLTGAEDQRRVPLSFRAYIQSMVNIALSPVPPWRRVPLSFRDYMQMCQSEALEEWEVSQRQARLANDLGWHTDLPWPTRPWLPHLDASET